MVARAWAASPAVDSAREPALDRFIDGLAALSGAEYVLAVDADGIRVRGEAAGRPDPSWPSSTGHAGSRPSRTSASVSSRTWC